MAARVAPVVAVAVGPAPDPDRTPVTDTARIVFTPSGRQGEVERGTNVLDAARQPAVALAA